MVIAMSELPSKGMPLMVVPGDNLDTVSALPTKVPTTMAFPIVHVPVPVEFSNTGPPITANARAGLATEANDE